MARNWMDDGAALTLGLVGIGALAATFGPGGSRAWTGGCPEGQTFVERKGYRRSDGAWVDPTSYCAPGSGMSRGRKTRGAPHEGGSPWITDEGNLGGPGYMSKTATERHAILDRCVDEHGYRSCLGSIQVLMRNRALYARHKRVLDSDNKYLVRTYGGAGAFGPRVRAQQRRRAA